MSRPITLVQRCAMTCLSLPLFFAFLTLDLPAQAQPQDDPPSPLFMLPPSPPSGERITRFIDDDRRIILRGNRHPLALARNDAGTVAPDFMMERMILTLLPSAVQQDALNQLLDAQHNPESAYYHQWLTPE